MINDRLKQIRDAERESHTEIYSSVDLFKEGSWLQKPVKTVLEIIPLLCNKKSLCVLDLGCGIGRNCIPIAKEFANATCKIDCIDILDLAIEKLNKNAELHNVSSSINGIVSAIEDYKIEQDAYDLIISVSALEHIDSKNSFINKLSEIEKGLKSGGIVCLIINADITEQDSTSGIQLEPQFEVNLPSNELIQILNRSFKNYNILKESKVHQKYEIPRDNRTISLETNVITLVAKKNNQI